MSATTTSALVIGAAIGCALMHGAYLLGWWIGA